MRPAPRSAELRLEPRAGAPGGGRDAYHFHWSRTECMDLSRRERAAWIEEIKRINKEIARSVKGRKR
ncbi:MAG: hypothetical protein Fur0037_02390 [Planctomycetota bacterium]